MEIQLLSTDKLYELDGVECRAWSGITSKGTPIVAYIHRIRCSPQEDQTEFDAELMKRDVPKEGL